MRFLLLVSIYFVLAPAHAKLCNPAVERCWKVGGSSSSSPAYPSRSSNIKINPAGVPLESVWGGEVLFYGGDMDFALVKGLGRVGAAVSPSNGEETFFGPMGFEMVDDYLDRMLTSEKYKSQKVTLAGAVGLWGNKKSGMKRLQVNLGLIGKYNRETENVWPGGGINAVMGPLTLGYSASQDNYLIEHDLFGEPYRHNYKYWIDTYSAGIFLNALAIDYSHMRIHTPDTEKPQTVTLITSSLLLRRWIFTLAGRHEVSERPDFNFATREIEFKSEKNETFGGAQFSATKVLMIGLFHNYYLMREISIGATLFF